MSAADDTPQGSPYDQWGFDRRFDWGRRGVRDAVARGDVILLVDVLSFSTTVCTATAHGATIHPCEMRDEEAAQAFAARVGARLRTGDLQAPTGRRALSPLGFGPADADQAFVLCSPNGATCSRLAAPAPAVFAGSLRNRGAVARAAAAHADAEGLALTVIACGELWRDVRADENVLRPCLEDALGAGAILAAAGGTHSPEAEACIAMWAGSRAGLVTLLRSCASGRELLEAGHGEDVAFASQLDVEDVAPRLTDGAYRPDLEKDA